MSPSSTSSSDARGPRAHPRPRRWRAFAAIVVVLLAAAEAALRVPEVRAQLPPRTHYYHPAIAQRIDAIERVLRTDGRIDVLFVGSSIVLTNVHPVLFDALAAPQPRRVVSFNAGLSGLWPTSVHLYVEHLWLPLARPRVVVQGVRYAEVAATTHAKHESQVWSGRIEPSWRDSGVATRLSAAIVSRVTLLQYQGVLTKALKRFRHGLVGTMDPEDEDDFSIRGYQPQDAPDNPVVDTWEADLPNTGTCVDGRCAVGFAALRRTVAAVRAAGGTYVLVNVPEHAARWDGPDAVARYRHYVEALRRFADAERVGFVDPTDGDPLRFAKFPFSDLSHMTASGARQFTRVLAGRLAPIIETAVGPARTLRAGDARAATSARGRPASLESLP